MTWTGSNLSGRCQVRLEIATDPCIRGNGRRQPAGGGVAGRQSSAQGGVPALRGEWASTRSPKPISCRILRPGTCLSGYLG
jgi:hypothetical protein